MPLQVMRNSISTPLKNSSNFSECCHNNMEFIDTVLKTIVSVVILKTRSKEVKETIIKIHLVRGITVSLLAWGYRIRHHHQCFNFI
jgi:hypothetical protein